MKKYLKLLYRKSMISYLELLKDDLKNNKRRFVVTANPETLMMAKKDKDVKNILLDERSSLVPDGILVVKACKKAKMDIVERITGIDIATFLLEYAHKNNYSMYLFGAKEEVIEELVKKINKKYAGINLLGYSDGYIEYKEELMDEIAKMEPDIVMVALGIPHQEKLIYRHLDKFKKGVLIGVGGSFDVLSGVKKRAPKIMIKLNLEWLYRILREPKRFKRFFQSNVKFLFKMRR